MEGFYWFIQCLGIIIIIMMIITEKGVPMVVYYMDGNMNLFDSMYDFIGIDASLPNLGVLHTLVTNCVFLHLNVNKACTVNGKDSGVVSSSFIFCYFLCKLCY